MVDIDSQQSQEAEGKYFQDQVVQAFTAYDSLFARSSVLVSKGVNLCFTTANWGSEWGLSATYEFTTTRSDKSLSQDITYGMSLNENRRYKEEVLKRIRRAGIQIDDLLHAEEFACAKYTIGENWAALHRYAVPYRK